MGMNALLTRERESGTFFRQSPVVCDGMCSVEKDS
ncbi:MAG: hypothetical protein BMS9Abin04_237 [Planctomycetia bacterium]|nr:MAG: hypothetical protein BMS9Abin04_237 [Planctomycetia bacterium]